MLLGIVASHSSQFWFHGIKYNSITVCKDEFPGNNNCFAEKNTQLVNDHQQY